MRAKVALGHKATSPARDGAQYRRALSGRGFSAPTSAGRESMSVHFRAQNPARRRGAKDALRRAPTPDESLGSRSRTHLQTLFERWVAHSRRPRPTRARVAPPHFPIEHFQSRQLSKKIGHGCESRRRTPHNQPGLDGDRSPGRFPGNSCSSAPFAANTPGPTSAAESTPGAPHGEAHKSACPLGG